MKHTFLLGLAWGLLFVLSILFGIALLEGVPDPFLSNASVVLVYLMVLPAVGFPVLYLSFYRWYKNPIGRALMTKAIGLAMLIGLSVFFHFNGSRVYSWAEEAQFMVFVLVCAGLWYQFLVFIKIRLQRKDHP